MDWNPLGTWHGMESFLRSIENSLPQRPTAIVLISAHWQAPEFSVTAEEQPGLIYDYYGFPEHTYQLNYPAKGSPALAQRVSNLLHDAGLEAHQTAERGFDHGMFIPLKVMFPKGDIPVVQLSLRHGLSPAAHMEAGKALSPLREENVLIIGSGMSFHNMSGYGDERFTEASERFDAWLKEAVQLEADKRFQRLRDWTLAPHALECHPSGEEEHLIPLMVVAGAANEDPGIQAYSERVMKTQLSAFRFG
jgi:aromatic ring-opening dioxygenase catalytic subunit (LigB family)